MCTLCERAAAQRLGLNSELSISASLPLPTDTVPSQALVSTASGLFSQELVAADGLMDMYLHAPEGAIEVSGGGEYNQTLGLPSVVIPAIRSKITNEMDVNYNILNQIPTLGSNPWVDGVSYDGKLFNPYTNVYTSINFNQAKNVYTELGFYPTKSQHSTLALSEEGKPVNISISFVSNPALPGSINETEGKGPLITWPENLKRGYLDAFKTMQDVANINIIEKVEGESVNIEYYLLNEESNTLGAHNGILDAPDGLPQTSWINTKWYNETTQITPGSSFLETAIHEIGHGLGLSHPHDAGLDPDNPSPVFPGLNPLWGGGDRFGAFGFGVNALNQNVFTVMSYNRGLMYDKSGLTLTKPNPTEGHSSTPMALDIMALQIKYGYNITTALDDNIYILPTSPSGLSSWSSIWDCGGTDVIDASSALDNVVIELRAAPMNAYRPQSGTMSELYNWEELGVADPADARALQNIIDVISPTGGLLGTTYQFARLTPTVVNNFQSDFIVNNFREANGQSFADYFQEQVNIAAKLDKSNPFALIEGFQDIVENMMRMSVALGQIDQEHENLRRDTYLNQQSILNESAANVGGYISQQQGNQGGFTIAAGTEIENAIGSNFNDTINGNHINNILNGLDGNDQFDGRQGNDTILGQAGDDIIDGGVGEDLLYGGAGSNIFINNRDGYSDILYIQSNQDLAASNNSATDVIYSLDSIDQIVITDSDAQSLRIETTNFENQIGIGLFAGTTLEAIYFGTNLSVEDLQNITTIA